MADEFDLSGVARRFVRGKRVIRIGLAVLASLLGIEAIYELVSSPPSNLNYGLVLIAWVACAIVFGFAYLTTLLPPTRLVVDESGFTLVTERGRRTVFRWDQPNLRLQFRDASGIDGAWLNERWNPWVISLSRGFFGGVVTLTTEAYTSVLRAAIARGLRVTPSNWEQPVNWERQVEIHGVDRVESRG